MGLAVGAAIADHLAQTNSVRRRGGREKKKRARSDQGNACHCRLRRLAIILAIILRRDQASGAILYRRIIAPGAAGVKKSVISTR